VYYGTDTRAVELLVGALLAIALTKRRRLEHPTTQRIAGVAGIAALLALVAAWVVVAQSDAMLYQGGLALHAVLVGAVIVAALVPGPTRALLATAPLVALGLISYGAYLYHWPIYLWLDESRTGLDGAALFALRLGVTLAVAWLSWYFVEQPIRHGRRITGWRPAVVAPVAAAIVAALLVALPQSTDEPEIVFAAVNKPNAALASSSPGDEIQLRRAAAADTVPAPGATLPVTGPTGAPAPAAVAPPPPPPVRRILLVGDSVAQTLGRGFERWAPRHGVTFVNGARFYCGIARGGRLGAAMGHSSDTCGDWAPTWSRLLDRVQPDVVVVLSTLWDISSRQRDDWGPDYLSQGDPRFDGFIVGEWGRAVDLLRSRGARVVWLTTPCVAEQQLSDDLDYANHRFLPVLARTHPVVRLDLRSVVCPGGRFSNTLGGVDDSRPDGAHFSDAGANRVADRLGPRLLDPALQSDRNASVPVRHH
jgi:hypothetical protein